MSKHVRRQIERIIDETGNGESSVIVRMGALGEDERSFLPIVSELMRRRNLSMTARDLLPVSQEALRRLDTGKMLTPAQRQRSDPRLSLAAQATLTEISLLGAGITRKVFGLEALAPLVRSGIVKIAQSRAAKRRGPRARGVPVTQFWTSKSAVLELNHDELAKLPEEVEGIQDVYPNRKLSVPRVVEAQRLPENVTDNKASSWGVNAIGALAAWGGYGARGEGVTVGLLDTGVDGTHPDLRGKIAQWAEFDINGRKVPNSRPHDTDRHGTHTAGTIVGGNASGQWIGVAPEAKLAVALVLDGKKGGRDAQVLAGIQWAIESGVQVISMSLGGLTLGPDVPNTYTLAILQALRQGIPVVAAIGNEGHQVTGSPGNDLLAFSIGATDHIDRAAGFSGGRTHIIRESNLFPPDALPITYTKPEVAAPGVGVMSSIPGGKWAAFNGTSMATPHVAGAIALLLSATSLAEGEESRRAFVIQDLITGSVEELGEAGQDQRFGFGRIDVLRAIGFAKDRGF